MNPKIYIFISVVLGVVGQLFFKKGVLKSRYFANVKERISLAWIRLLFERNIFLGLLMYLFSSVFWLLGLSRLELSYAFPFIGLAVVAVPMFSALLYGEKLSFYRKLGIAIICAGVLFIAQS